MAFYLLRRLGQSLLILIGVSLITYILLYLIPADPVRQIAGRSATAETVENIRRQLGLDLPLWQQYLRYLGEVATAVSDLNRTNRDELYKRLVRVAKRKTSEADTRLDDRGRRIDEDEESFGSNVMIVDPEDPEEELLARSRAGDPQARLF